MAYFFIVRLRLLSSMNRSIALIGILFLFLFSIVLEGESVMKVSATEASESIQAEKGVAFSEKTTCFISGIATGARTGRSAYETYAQDSSNFTSILQTRNDFRERVHLQKFLKINPALGQLRMQSEMFAQDLCRLPDRAYHSYKFACNYYLYTLRRILI